MYRQVLPSLGQATILPKLLHEARRGMQLAGNSGDTGLLVRLGAVAARVIDGSPLTWEDLRDVGSLYLTLRAAYQASLKLLPTDAAEALGREIEAELEVLRSLVCLAELRTGIGTYSNGAQHGLEDHLEDRKLYLTPDGHRFPRTQDEEAALRAELELIASKHRAYFWGYGIDMDPVGPSWCHLYVVFHWDNAAWPHADIPAATKAGREALNRLPAIAE